MAIDEAGVASIAYKYVKEPAEEFANNLYESRKATAASVVHTEEERAAVMESESVKYILQLSETTLFLQREETNQSLAEKLVNEGKPVPLSGGDNGIVTEIDGSKRPSKVPAQLQGQPMERYAWPATNFIDETQQMLETTLSDVVSDAISSDAQSEIAEFIKPSIAEELQNQFGGGS